mgnify:CR=1 FL=1
MILLKEKSRFIKGCEYVKDMPLSSWQRGETQHIVV